MLYVSYFTIEKKCVEQSLPVESPLSLSGIGQCFHD